MAEKKPWRDPEQNDEKELLKDDDGLWHFRVPEADRPGLAGPADSQWSTGRNCPKCAGQLEFFEIMEKSEYIMVRCKQDPAHKFFTKDLEPKNYDPLDDADKLTLPYDNALFRDIPADRVLYYMNRIDRQKQKEERG